MLRYIAILSLLLMAIAIAGCSGDQHDHPDLKTGQQLYEYHCASCHKEDGTGIFLKGVPANRDTDLSVWQIIHKVQMGSEEKSAMPSFEKMPQQEASKIAIYLKQLGQK